MDYGCVFKINSLGNRAVRISIRIKISTYLYDLLAIIPLCGYGKLKGRVLQHASVCECGL